MARSPLTETIQRVNGMVHYVQENLTADEYMLFLDLVVPEPEPEAAKPAKKKRKSRAAKSPRAANMAATLSRNLAGQRQQERCAGTVPMNGGEVVCDGSPDDAIHDPTRGYAGYHEFVAPGTGQLPARCVAGLPNGVGTCGLGVNDVLHQNSSYGNYHEFVAPGAQVVEAGAGD